VWGNIPPRIWPSFGKCALYFGRPLYWPRLCPHSGERACPENAVYNLNDSSSCFTQRLFPPSGFSAMYSEYFIIIHGSGTYIVHHIHMSIHILILHIIFIRTFTSSFLHFFCSSWQAGCPRLFVSDTLVTVKNEREKIRYVEKELRILVSINCHPYNRLWEESDQWPETKRPSLPTNMSLLPSVGNFLWRRHQAWLSKMTGPVQVTIRSMIQDHWTGRFF
jgi:hypothetical protein